MRQVLHTHIFNSETKEEASSSGKVDEKWIDKRTKGEESLRKNTDSEANGNKKGF